jgi:hypothetical protein
MPGSAWHCGSFYPYGVTDDFDLGFFLKRIRAAAELLGDSAFHTQRYAALQGL